MFEDIDVRMRLRNHANGLTAAGFRPDDRFAALNA